MCDKGTPIRTTFLVGNGTSRSGFLLSQLRGKGLIIGCNMAYRDFPDFDAVVSIDGRPSKHIDKEFKGLHLFNNSFKTRNIYCGSLSYVIGELPNLKDKMDSGKLATYLASQFFKAQRLIMIGMDFGGTDLYSETNFELRPNFEKDWNVLLNGFEEVYRVGSPTSACDRLDLKQITYTELKDLICA